MIKSFFLHLGSLNTISNTAIWRDLHAVSCNYKEENLHVYAISFFEAVPNAFITVQL